MTSVFAEYERALINERYRRGRLHMAHNGKVIISVASYGYKYIPRSERCSGRLLINDGEAEVVRMIFQWLIEDHLTISAITRRLNQSRILTRSGTEWQSGTISNLLRNEIYAGTYYYNRERTIPSKQKNLSPLNLQRKFNISRELRLKDEWIAVSVTPIIERKTWEAAKDQLQLNQQHAKRNNHKHDYLLKSLLVCAFCILRMAG